MRYKYNNEIYYDIDQLLDDLIDYDYHDQDDYFEEWVNETYGSIEIAGDTYYAYDIIDNAGDGNMSYLHEQYNEVENDNDRDNARWELSNANPGDEVYCQDQTIYVLEDEDDEEENDYDRDESIENLRRIISEQNERQKVEEERNKAEENDIMSLFQVVS